MKNNGHPQEHKSVWTGTDWRRAMDLAHSAPRCKATAKHSKAPCKAPAVKGWTVCHKHGARGGAPRGERNGNYRHGRHTQEVRELRSQNRIERAKLTAMLRAFDECDGSEADLLAKLAAAGLL